MSFVPLGLLFLRVLAALPTTVSLSIGRLIGRVLYRVARSRRLVCERNISVCFPTLSQDAQNGRVRACFIESGIGLVETAWAWHRPMNFVDTRMQVSGIEHLQGALSEGRGVLLLCPHYSMLDLVAPLVHQAIGRFTITYRPNDNARFNEAVVAGRSRYADLVDVRAIREMARHLKDGRVVWFGPDQDMGPRGSVFAPFFGRLASTVTTPARLTRMSGATPVFLDLHRDGDTYWVTFKPLSPEYPRDDEIANATELNRLIEEALRAQPAQYMWMHKRFKTNPDLTRQTLYQAHQSN